MADVSVKMGVSGISQFKSAMQQAQGSVKNLDAALKLNEKQYRATGDSAEYMQTKSALLKQKLEAQRSAATNAEKALAQLKSSGVDPLSKAYQDMERQMLNAQSAMLDTEAEINGVGTASATTAAKTEELGKSLSGLNKKVSLDQVISGIGSITNAMEAAGKAAARVGNQIWDNIMDSARWADNAETMAQVYQIPLQRYLQMDALVQSGLDTTVEAIQGSMSKMKKNVANEATATMDALKEMGLVTTETIDQGFGRVEREVSLYKDADDLFWKAGKAIMGMGDAFDKEAAAQAVFGKSWRELIPLFEKYENQEAFEKALQETTTTSEEAIHNNASLADSVADLEQKFSALKGEVIGSLAPALEGAANSLSGLLEKIMEYLKSPEGQQALEDMGKAVSGLFDDLGKIDPKKVVQGFADVFGKIVEGITWISNNWSSVVTAIEAIGIAFGGMKIAEVALNIGKIVSGFQTLWKGANNPIPQVPGGSGADTTAANAASNTVTNAAKGTGFWATIKAGVGNVLSALAVPLAGTALSAAAFYGIAKGASANNYTYRGTYDPTRYSDMENAKQLQTGVRGVIGSNGSNAGWNLGYFTSHIATPEQLFSLFNYTDAKLGDTNWLTNAGGTNSQMAAAIWAMYSKRFGGANTEMFNNLSAEQRAMLLGGQDAYAQIQQSGGSLDYTWLLTGMKDYFSHNGVFDENGNWTIPGIEEATTSQTEAAESMNAAAEVMAELPQSVADAIKGIELKVEMPTGFLHANGLDYVPFDGYPALLHKGERIQTAREAQGSRSFSSNLYVESMIMNNSTDAEGLAAAMAAAQRRTMSGYGS